jgi:hypothetical protein
MSREPTVPYGDETGRIADKRHRIMGAITRLERARELYLADCERDADAELVLAIDSLDGLWLKDSPETEARKEREAEKEILRGVWGGACGT